MVLYMNFLLILICGHQIRQILSEANSNGWLPDDPTLVSEVVALYDNENNLVFYKDLSIPACFVEENSHSHSQSHFKILSVPNNSIPIQFHSEKLRKSKFIHAFCGDELPIYGIQNSESETLKRVHRNRRKKREFSRYYNGNGGNNGVYYPAQQPQINVVRPNAFVHTNNWHHSQRRPMAVTTTHARGHAQNTNVYYSKPSYPVGNSYSSGSIWSSKTGMRPGTTMHARQGQGQGQTGRTLVLEPGQTSARQIRVTPNGNGNINLVPQRQQKLRIPATWTKNIQIPEGPNGNEPQQQTEFFGVRPEDDLEEQEYIGEGRGQKIGGTNGRKIPIPMNILPHPVPPGFRLVSRTDTETQTHTGSGYLIPENGHSTIGGSTGHQNGHAHAQDEGSLALGHIEQSYPLAPPTPGGLILQKERFDQEPPKVLGEVPEGVHVRVTKTQRHWEIQNEGEPVLQSSSTRVFTNEDGQSSQLHEQNHVQNGGHLDLGHQSNIGRENINRQFTRTEYTQQNSGNSGHYLPPGPGERSTTFYYPQGQGSDQIGQGQLAYPSQPQQFQPRNPQNLAPGSGQGQGHPQRCRLVTFTCTIVNNSNGRTKLCKPVTQNSGIGGQTGTGVQQSGQGEQQITCCCCC